VIPTSTDREKADTLTRTIKGLLNFEVISRQDSENVSAVVQEIAAALAEARESALEYAANRLMLSTSLESREDVAKAIRGLKV
jgi:hypothetical protein